MVFWWLLLLANEGTLHGRGESIVQTQNLMPTILDLANIHPPPTVQGKSVLPLIRGEETQETEIAVSSFSLVRQKLPPWITVTSKEWSLLTAQIEAKTESELYDLSNDPNETENIHDERPDVAEELRLKLIEFLRSRGTKPEKLNKWTAK
ncbi:MAG: DUF4976 domain-containing protein [Candidatus Bathyarchaeota archaeon]|nr:DUF4976 domain-containing protein [Candidatus Bathyarchaeota archaeon]